MKFPGFQNMSTPCLMAIVSLRNWYTKSQMASFQNLDATVHKNITYTHSSIQFLLSQINPNCTNNVFLGTLYRCNGGRFLTVVRAHVEFCKDGQTTRVYKTYITRLCISQNICRRITTIVTTQVVQQNITNVTVFCSIAMPMTVCHLATSKELNGIFVEAKDYGGG